MFPRRREMFDVTSRKTRVSDGATGLRRFSYTFVLLGRTPDHWKDPHSLPCVCTRSLRRVERAIGAERLERLERLAPVPGRDADRYSLRDAPGVPNAKASIASPSRTRSATARAPRLRRGRPRRDEWRTRRHRAARARSNWRVSLRTRSASSRRTASPAACPCWSLTRLKSSRSMRSKLGPSPPPPWLGARAAGAASALKASVRWSVIARRSRGARARGAAPSS